MLLADSGSGGTDGVLLANCGVTNSALLADSGGTDSVLLAYRARRWN